MPRRLPRSALFLLAGLLLWPLALFAQVPPPVGGISDAIGALDTATRERIEKVLRDTEAETGVRIVVALIGARADYGDSGTLETFATNLFNTWRVGDGSRDDGILLLMAQTSGEVRIALGAGYGSGYDEAAKRVIETVILPQWRSGKGAGEVAEIAARAITDQIARPFASGGGTRAFNPDWVFIPLVGGIALFAFRRRIGDMIAGRRRCPSCGARALQRQVVPGPTGETVVLRCTACGHETRLDRKASRGASGAVSERDRGPRDGGGGGGRSGGGGASGQR